MRPITLIVPFLSISYATALVTGAECTSQCANPASVTQNCDSTAGNDPASCTCSNDFITALQSCYQCLVSNSAMTSEAANDALASAATGCADAGHPISTLTVSGGGSAATPEPSSGASTGSPAASTQSPAAAKKNSAERFILGSSLSAVSALVGLGSMVFLV